MISQNDFQNKQIVFYVPAFGDKMSFANDNLVIKDREGNIKLQVTCYRIFIIFVVGDTSFTTGIINRSNKFGFSICLMNRNLKVYKFISSRMEGNTVLRSIQYHYNSNEIGQRIILNKVMNQRSAIVNIRNKNQLQKEAIVKLDDYIKRLESETLELHEILGLEGSASRVYFPQIFDKVKWNGRKPRIKMDVVNASMDIGYTILFNIIDGLVNVYGFDEYCGVLHKKFYMRKSLVCDLMEPFRPIVDYTIRKNINLGAIKEDDFSVINNSYILQWKYSNKYARLFLEEILKYKDDLFLYIQSYYRAFMKQKAIDEYPLYVY